MNRAYVSCGYNERNHPKVQELLPFFSENGVVSECAPNPGFDVYENTIAAIERSDVFVAVFLDGHHGSTQLLVELFYAIQLREMREGLRLITSRPRIFGWRLCDLPKFVNIEKLEWISDDKSSWDILLKPISLRETENKFFDETVQKIMAKLENS